MSKTCSYKELSVKLLGALPSAETVSDDNKKIEESLFTNSILQDMSCGFSSSLDFHAYLDGAFFLFIEKTKKPYVLISVTCKIFSV